MIVFFSYSFFSLSFSLGFTSRSETTVWEESGLLTSGSFSSLLEFFLAHEFSSRGLSPFLILAIRYERDFSFLSNRLFLQVFALLRKGKVVEDRLTWSKSETGRWWEGRVREVLAEREVFTWEKFYLREDGRENEQTRRGSVGRNTTGREEDLLWITWHLCSSSLYFSLKWKNNLLEPKKVEKLTREQREETKEERESWG